MALGKLEAILDILTGGTESKIQLDIALAAAYSAGLLSYDQVRKVVLTDTGYTDAITGDGVRTSSGMELYIPFFNDTGAQIANGKAINVAGFDATNDVLKGVLAKADSGQTSSAVIGVSTHAVNDQEVGVATVLGEVHDVDTSLFTGAGPLYLSDSVAGGMTQTRPQYPSNIVIMGSITKVHASEGIIFSKAATFKRPVAVKDYHVSPTPSGSGATGNYVAGFYAWPAAAAVLDQASPSIVLGSVLETRAAHVGIVPEAAGTVDTGQVGLQVTGTLDSESGPQTAAQTAIITEDITTLTADVMIETLEKFSGQPTISFYTFSGAPVNYSLNFNYGFSKYEDYGNSNFTFVNFEAVWRGAASDTGMDITVFKQHATGWNYSLATFVAGDTPIIQRSVDQQLASIVAGNVLGAYKRVEINEYIAGGDGEGLIIRLDTATNNSIAGMDIHMVAYGEDLI